MVCQATEWLQVLCVCVFSMAHLSFCHTTREAWHKLADMPPLEAMKEYVAAVSVLVPDWETVRPEHEAAATHVRHGVCVVL